MKKNYFILFIVLAFIGFNGYGQNQVVNPDFENWTAGAADNWLADGGAIAITQNTATVQNGTSSCEVVWTSQDNQYLTSDAFVVTPGIEINANFWVYDNDAAGRARLCIIYEGADNYFGDYSEDLDDWQQLAYTNLVPAGATSATFQIRFYDVSSAWIDGATVIVDNVVFEANTSVNPEPTNYPTDFDATAAGTKIITSWVDAVGDQLPLSYVVIGRNDGAAITAPVDGTPVEDDSNWDDGQIAMNVIFGVQTYAVSVAANTDYTFAIYPYSNTGDAIDYKTGGTAPTASATSSNTTVINEETFDTDLGAWTAFTVTGEQVWEWADYGVPPGCAKMSGFSGAAVANEDWLISPSLNLNALEIALFSFDHARNYGTNEALFILVSTDYDGSSDPSTNGTWSDITSMFVFPDPGTWDFSAAGEADVTAYKGANTYFAFKYTSSDTDAATWEVDNALIYGIGGGSSAVKLDITSVNNGDPITEGEPFTVTVQAQDASNVATDVDTDVDVTLSVGTGVGTIGGTITGTITSGTNTITISGVTYSPFETGVVLNVVDDAANLAAGNSDAFNVLEFVAGDLLAQFESDINIVVVGNSVEFTDLSIGDITSWEWEFEGGTPATYTGQTPPAIVYSEAGEWDVTLTVEDDINTNTITYTDYIKSGVVPVADFEATFTDVIVGSYTNFVDLSVGENLTYAWSFEGGDPATSTVSDPGDIYYLINDVTYYDVTLVVSNEFGESTLIKEDYIFTFPEGIEESNLNDSNFTIYPNPANSTLTISVPENNETKIEVYSIEGRLMISTIVTSTEKINIDSFENGMYLIRATDTVNGNSVFEKLIKN